MLDDAQNPTTLYHDDANVQSLNNASWDPCLDPCLDPCPNTSTHSFFDGIDLHEHTMANPSQSTTVLVTTKGTQPAEQSLPWHLSNARNIDKFLAPSTLIDNSLSKPKDNHFPSPPEVDPQSRAATRGDLLNSPFPTETYGTAANHAMERPASRSEPQTAFIAWTPSTTSLQAKAIDSSGNSGNTQISSISDTSHQEASRHGSISGLAASLQPRHPEKDLAVARLNYIVEPANRGQRRSTDSSSEDGMYSVSTSPESVLVWRHLIHTCCENGHLPLVEELLEVGLDINTKDSAGNTPLHIAAGAGHVNVLRFLLMKGCDVNAINNAGWTAAHLASIKGHRHCLRLLLENNASPWARLNVQDE